MHCIIKTLQFAWKLLLIDHVDHKTIAEISSCQAAFYQTYGELEYILINRSVNRSFNEILLSKDLALRGLLKHSWTV